MIRCKEIVEAGSTNPKLHLSTSNKKGTVESAIIGEDQNLYSDSIILTVDSQNQSLSTDHIFEDSSLENPVIGIPDLTYILPQLHFKSVPLYNTPSPGTRGPQDIFCISPTTDPELEYNTPIISWGSVAIWHPVICSVTSINYPRFNIGGLINLLQIVHKNDDTSETTILTKIIKAFIEHSAFTSLTPEQLQSGILYGDMLWLQIMKTLLPKYIIGRDFDHLLIRQNTFIKDVRRIPEPIIQLHEGLPLKGSLPVYTTLGNGGEITFPLSSAVPDGNHVGSNNSYLPFITLSIPEDTPLRKDLKIYYILYTSDQKGTVPTSDTPDWVLYTGMIKPAGEGYFDVHGAFIGQIVAICTTQTANAGTLNLSSKTCSEMISRPRVESGLYIYTEAGASASILEIIPSSGAIEPLDIFASN